MDSVSERSIDAYTDDVIKIAEQTEHLERLANDDSLPPSLRSKVRSALDELATNLSAPAAAHLANFAAQLQKDRKILDIDLSSTIGNAMLGSDLACRCAARYLLRERPELLLVGLREVIEELIKKRNNAAEELKDLDRQLREKRATAGPTRLLVIPCGRVKRKGKVT